MGESHQNGARALAIALLAGGAWAAQAQPYPTKPIRMIVAVPPGGPADTMGRLVSQKLSETLKQQFVVENRAGAGGVGGGAGR